MPTPSLPDHLRQLYTRVFNAETDRIPLVVTPPCGVRPTREALIHDTENAIPLAAQALRPKADVGADWIPSVGISWYQCILVPAAFGARPICPPGSEPIVEPVFRNLAQALDAGVPPLEGPLVDDMLRTLDTALRVLPEGFLLSFPPTVSPFDLAQLLLPGEEFLAALLTEPEPLLQFLDNLSHLCIRAFQITRERLGPSGSLGITNRGLYYPGLRLPCDAIVNFPPDAIRAVAQPVLAQFGRRFGKLCIHYCSKPAPSGHVLPALVSCPHVNAVDTWQGPDAFIGTGAPDPMQNRVGLIFDTDLTTPEKMDAFLALPPVRDVPRRGGRPLVLHTPAPSVEDARRIYALWREKMGE